MHANTLDRTLSHEARLLLDLTRAALTDNVLHYRADGVDWDRLETYAGDHGLIPLLSGTVAGQLIPKQKREHWKHIRIGVAYQASRARATAAKFLGFLDNEDIPAVVLRGVALAYTCYPDPGFRPMSDIDVLVPTKDGPRIVASLAKHGLHPCKIRRYQFLYKLDGFVVEIHWSYLTTRRYRKMADFDTWITSRIPLGQGSERIWCLSPETQLLDIILHAFLHHQLDSLQKLVDVAMLLRTASLDWAFVANWCREARATRLVSFVLNGVDDLFALGYGSSWSSAGLSDTLDRPGWDAFVKAMFRQDSLACSLHRGRVLLAAAEPPFRKINQLFRFVSPDHMRELLKLLRPHRQAHTAAYAFKNIPRRKPS